MADVFLAQGPPPWGHVVIKILREEYRGLADVLSMFRDEARLLATLSHPQVVHLLDSGEEQGFPWMALEYLEGDHLGIVSRALRRAGRPCPAALGLLAARQAAEALGYLHALRNPDGRPAGVVHRDVSPQNLFLCIDGRLKLLDFGIALHAKREALTRTGLLKGKLAYMPPEQVRGEAVDRRADLWALGVTLWELLAGRRLFKHAAEFELMTRVCTQPIPDLAGLRPDLPASLLQAVAGCLRRNPAERPRHADELVAGLPPAGEAEMESVARLAEELLGQRVRDKRAILRALKRRETLDLRLFGDLDLSGADGEDELSADDLAPPPAPMPALPEIDGPAPGSAAGRLGRDVALPGGSGPPLELAEAPPAAPAAMPPQLEPPAVAERPPLAPPAPPARPARPARRAVAWALVGLLALGLAGAGVGAWWAWGRRAAGGPPPPGVGDALPVARPGQPPPRPPARARDEAEGLPGPQGLVSTREPGPALRGQGLLSLECDRPVEVRLGGRRLGVTPLSRVPLPQGEHRLVLEAAGGERRAAEVRLEAGRHTRSQVVFY